MVPPDKAPTILTWPELSQKLKTIISDEYSSHAVNLTAIGYKMEMIMNIVEESVKHANIEGPIAIIGLAPPYYPRSALTAVRDKHIILAIERVIKTYNDDSPEKVSLIDYFPGISDMSFINPCDEDGTEQLVGEYNPIYQFQFTAPFSCPIVNIGPWGREYHQLYERINVHYAFNQLPKLLKLGLPQIS